MAALLFAPFSSEIELPFYSALFSSKLEHDKLDDSARPVLGLYEPRPVEPAASGKMQILGNALSSAHTLKPTSVPLQSVRAEGFIKNVNTIEDFKKIDKDVLLQTAARSIWDAIKDGTIYQIPSLLSSFTILSFADLKKYKFYYWFAFPAIHSNPTWKRVGSIERLGSKECQALVDKIGTWKYSVDNREHGFFLAKRIRTPPPTADNSDDEEADGGSTSEAQHEDPTMASYKELGFYWVVGSLRKFESGFFEDVDEADRYVSFVDPSTYAENPGWPSRNLLVLIRQRFKLRKFQLLCFRDTQARRHEARSIIMTLEMDTVPEMELSEMPKVTGWERHTNTKLQARIANLAEYMDPTRLADSAVDLNLKLMKWRISPNLNLDIIKDTKCLLLGAGTLGGYVSRNLMGWGVRRITFIDYGKVSYSNPVRQPLFTFEDCQGGGAPKAPTAAKALKAIYPGVDSEGHEMEVPMLGHPYTNEAKTKEYFTRLRELIDEHDVIFLLMDSRESRWLPTVMGKAAGKIVMNAALGFDSYVVMRHGAEVKNDSDATLGCYFCNDVVAPGDSMKDQTLDQQCTVTRPGVAAIASALLVEVLTSLLQHPLGNKADAPQPSQGKVPNRDPEDHALGLVPHQIRGFLDTFQQLVIRGQAYDCCSACSPKVLEAYRKDGWEFVKRALLEKDFVAELSGLAEVQRQAEAAAAQLEWSDDGEDGGDGDGELI